MRAGAELGRRGFNIAGLEVERRPGGKLRGGVLSRRTEPIVSRRALAGLLRRLRGQGTSVGRLVHARRIVLARLGPVEEIQQVLLRVGARLAGIPGRYWSRRLGLRRFVLQVSLHKSSEQTSRISRRGGGGVYESLCELRLDRIRRWLSGSRDGSRQAVVLTAKLEQVKEMGGAIIPADSISSTSTNCVHQRRGEAGLGKALDWRSRSGGRKAWRVDS